MDQQEPKRQRLTGTVVSAKMQKTVVVEVTSKKRHPKYHKSYSVTRRFKAHTEEQLREGDQVTIEGCRPISKDKRFRVVPKA